MEQKDKKFSEWHGIPREKINWNPVIDENKCIGCGLCVTTCGRGVYKFNFEKNKPEVVNPNNCMVACQTCSNLCPAKAISFAKEDKTREKAQDIVKTTKILPRVKKELELRKEELKYK
jgi:NAD-dependent dihydropyrimidine dehydrogenase PreA subunit